MKRNKLWVVTVFLLFMLVMDTAAQDAKLDPAKHEKKVRDMVAFLEYVLNTLGNNSTSSRDKDVLITESYTKIFRDAKVQIEDDLVEKRNVITNKDVQAYLKDVDFFFDNVKFEFHIKDIQGKVNANGKLFYKVSLTRNLRGATVEGKSVNNTIPRYIEVNYDPKDQDLKIVSIYTNEFNEKDALLNWWKQLSFEWQSVFKKELGIVSDSVQLADLKNMISINALDLSHNQYIQTIEPLTQLVDLQKLDLSNVNITDLSPARNFTALVELDLSHTKIEDISALKYSDRLEKLNINNTGVRDITVIEKMLKLQSFEMSATEITDFTPLSNLTELQYLNLKATKIADLAPVATLTNIKTLDASKTLIGNLNPITGLKNLTTLAIDSTSLTNISPLSNLANLKVLYMNYTAVSDLSPLKGLTHLEKIYCDHTPIKRDLASAFMASNPGVLVIVDSEDLRHWWDTLPSVWQEVLHKAAKTGLSPTNEELAKVINLDSVNFAGNAQIHDIEPLRKLPKLQIIIARGAAINNLSPLQEHKEIRSLNISDTQVSDISVLNHFTKIKELWADNTKIHNIDSLPVIASLKKLYVDQMNIEDLQVRGFLNRNPGCLVVYKTSLLEKWWNELPEDWKKLFQTQINIGVRSKREDLHRLAELEALHLGDAPVSDLSPLSVFVRLKELHFAGTAITDISPLASIKSLRSLYATSSPIRKLEPIGELTNMTDLDISNTPADDLKPLSHLQDLKKLNCSGTPIKSLSALEKLKALEYLDCSNTNIKKLNSVNDLPLKTLKCYNTDIPSRRIEAFKKRHPDCNVIYYR